MLRGALPGCLWRRWRRYRGVHRPSNEPVAGGEARILTLSDPRTLDPAILGNAYASGALLGNALYGTLMTNDEADEVQYSMAESFTTTDNGATFTLKLRPGLVFSDGTPLNAEAVKFNWDRTKDPAVGSAHRSEAAMIQLSEAVDDVTLKATWSPPFRGTPSPSSPPR
ncbi:Extracellular solute-binding protein family 5 [Frankia sp. Hr75.2]|nr:Extracellular solute-binding protein family 5 [Frankia sp. Hr75.2]